MPHNEQDPITIEGKPLKLKLPPPAVPGGAGHRLNASGHESHLLIDGKSPKITEAEITKVRISGFGGEPQEFNPEPGADWKIEIWFTHK